jgi:hypothetical protein
MKVFLFLFLIISNGYAQQVLQGKIIDNKNHGISFASIGIIGKKDGTLSLENGDFVLKLTNSNNDDSLKISYLGFKSISLCLKNLRLDSSQKFILIPQEFPLNEVLVKPKKVKYKFLGSTNYYKGNCSGFADAEGNWKGSEAAILIKNNKKILFESFQFYVVQNKYKDSLLFRLNFYKNNNGLVGETILQKPIIFKLGIQQGEFKLLLDSYQIFTNSDFFVSLECLMDEMEMSKFCYAGSPFVHSFVKVKAFSKWQSSVGRRNGGGGGDFNLKIAMLED